MTLQTDQNVVFGQKSGQSVIFRMSLSHEMPILVSDHVVDNDTTDARQKMGTVMMMTDGHLH